MKDIPLFNKFNDAIKSMEESLINTSHKVENKKWQSIDVSDKKEFTLYEVLNKSFKVPIYTSNLETLAEDIKPNLPWANDHFEERVSGQPLNPGKEWANWPYNKSADTFRDGQGTFSHTYMERIWPKNANEKENIEGIRYKYGDLDSVVDLLEKDINTRQAFLPIWFPEDTGNEQNERVPCTLGYHFIHRNGFMHVNYHIRSCDFVRHFRDDIYLSTRLNLYVMDELNKRLDVEEDIKPGFYTQHTASMHCFENDYRIMSNEREK